MGMASTAAIANGSSTLSRAAVQRLRSHPRRPLRVADRWVRVTTATVVSPRTGLVEPSSDWTALRTGTANPRRVIEDVFVENLCSEGETS